MGACIFGMSFFDHQCTSISVGAFQSSILSVFEQVPFDFTNFGEVKFKNSTLPV